MSEAIYAIKMANAELFTRSGNVTAIIETEAGFEVHQWTADSVCPPSVYPTARLAASRILQLLGIGPVAPQTHPELATIEFAVNSDKTS